MNKHHFAYFLGFPFNRYCDFLLYSFSIKPCMDSYNAFSEGRIGVGIAGAVFSSLCCTYGLLYGGLPRIATIPEGIKLFLAPERYPFESTTKVVISDRAGVEQILSETARESKTEWGTVFKFRQNQGVTSINEILPIEEARSQNFITDSSSNVTSFNPRKMQREGFLGSHHYHPEQITEGMSAVNYVINATDRRVLFFNSVKLLSFSTSYGPELIAYNRRYVYLPQNDEKTEFQRASPRDILHYLSEKGGK